MIHFYHSPSSLVRHVTVLVKFDWPLLLAAAPAILYSRYFDKFVTSPCKFGPLNSAVVTTPVNTSDKVNMYLVIIPRRNGSGTGLQLILILVELV